LWIAHSHLAVNNHQYDIMMKLYVKMLKKEKIPKKETEECLESLEKMRAPTVDRDLKFKNMYLKHSEALAAAAGGDGWGVTSGAQREREEKEKAAQALAAKRRLEEAAKAEAAKPKAAGAAAASAPAPKAKAKAALKAAAPADPGEGASGEAKVALAKAKAKAPAAAPAEAPASASAPAPEAKAAGPDGDGVLAAKAATPAKAPTPQNPITKVVGPGFTKASQTLYERLGGEQALDRIVTGVYDAMKADKEIGKFFARFRLEKLKERTVDYLRGEWGGEPYKGSDLWIAHSHLAVNNHQYDIMMKLYVKMLKKEKIPKKETEECLESLEKMRAPTVDRDLKIKNMYLKHSEALAAAAGGDGWGVQSGAQKEREERERAAQALAEKKLEEAKRQVATRAATSDDQTAPSASAPAPTAKAKAKSKSRAKAKAKASDAPEVSKLEPPEPASEGEKAAAPAPQDGAAVAAAEPDKTQQQEVPSEDSTEEPGEPAPVAKEDTSAELPSVMTLAEFDGVAIVARGRVRLTVCM